MTSFMSEALILSVGPQLLLLPVGYLADQQRESEDSHGI